MKKLLFGVLMCVALEATAQITVTPAFPTADEEITIVYDATQGTSGLVGVSQVMMHAGVVLSGPNGTGWENVQGEWGNPGSVGQMTNLGNNKWQIKIKPRIYFNVPADTRIYRIGMVFRSAGPCGGYAGNSTVCKEGKTSGNSDFFVDLFEANVFAISISSPASFPVFKNNGEQISISASTSEVADISIAINGISVATATDATTIMHTHTIIEGAGVSEVTISADNGTLIEDTTFTYVVRSATINQPRPAAIIDGINYGEDDTKVTLSLWAPDKSSVYVIGDFSDWEILPQYQMKKSGEHFWIEIADLEPGVEYGYQYLIDETLRLADPYADKILDPDDNHIPDHVYPNLKTYPFKARNEKWYFNRVAVLQTSQTPYDWQVDNFVKPEKEKLVVYELLVRDFFADGQRNYQNLVDTISYFKRLGINAIELMPVTEFNGNESWGYNPTFMFAPDKYYGTKNKLKEFIDVCHQNGIAVILDLVMNQQDLPNSYLMMDFDFNAMKPTSSNKWFNENDKHPYAVFFDVNHESSYTKHYLDTITHYWLNEYKMDGYRFDLAKGFTQNTKCGGSTTDEGCFAAKDDSRIAILKRMSDAIWSHTPDAYVILELFSDKEEEKELVEYRAAEGKGMMVWGNLNHAYAQNTIGQTSGADISWISYKNRNWSVPHVIGYMESHDEERMMFRNLQEGGSSSSYNVRTLSTALDRAKAAASIFFTIPGPKMIWQFGELGYDISLNFNGRVSPKPIKWEYYDNESRKKLLQTYAALIKLKTSYDVFNTKDFTLQGSSLVKQLLLKNEPYTNAPTSADEMNVVVVANFNVTSQQSIVTFPHAGNWYQYFSQDDTLEVNALLHTFSLQPGEFRIYTDVKLPVAIQELNPFVTPLAPDLISVEEIESKIVIAWQDKSSIENGYRIYRKSGGGSFSLIGDVAKSIISYTDNSGLLPETTYTYYVEAYNGTGEATSDIIEITTSPNLVTDNEEDLDNEVIIFPNPVQNVLNVQSGFNTISEVLLTGVRGDRQKITRLTKETWDLQNISRGLYVAEIRTQQGIVRKKIVKQ